MTEGAGAASRDATDLDATDLDVTALPDRGDAGSRALEVVDLAVRLGTTQALADVSLTVAAGDVLTVLGASGSGKSTLLRIVAGLVEPDVGTVLLDGEDVTDDPPETRGVGLVFQDHALFPHLSVGDNVAFAASLRGADRHARRAVVQDWLPRVGLDGMADRDPATLSGGQRQRVALARALASEPRVLLLDEPFGALDAPLRRELGAMVRQLVRDTDVPAVLVTHDRDEALGLGDHLAVLEAGVVRQHGSVAAVVADPVDALVAEAVGHTLVGRDTALALGADEPPGDAHRLLVPPGAVTRDETTDATATQVRAVVERVTPSATAVVVGVRLVRGPPDAVLDVLWPQHAEPPRPSQDVDLAVTPSALRWLP